MSDTKATVIHVRDMQPGDIYIGRAVPRRGLKASKWANPFKVGKDGTRAQVLNKYAGYVMAQPRLMRSLSEIRGKRLACWCAPDSCHGDVLADLVDAT